MGKKFLDKMPKAQETKVKVFRWDFIKLNSICTAKETSEETTYRMRKYL